jgi:hypothetical protein
MTANIKDAAMANRHQTDVDNRMVRLLDLQMLFHIMIMAMVRWYAECKSWFTVGIIATRDNVGYVRTWFTDSFMLIYRHPPLFRCS